MADLLERASAWLDGMRTKFASRQVVYQRSVATVRVSAGIGRTQFQVDNGTGVIETFESRDYLILAADLVLNGPGQPVFPQPGDTIVDGGQVYQVLIHGNEPAWRYSDPFRKTLRIHTKHIGAA